MFNNLILIYNLIDIMALSKIHLCAIALIAIKQKQSPVQNSPKTGN